MVTTKYAVKYCIAGQGDVCGAYYESLDQAHAAYRVECAIHADRVKTVWLAKVLGIYRGTTCLEATDIKILLAKTF